jgi:hypothetical protein
MTESEWLDRTDPPAMVSPDGPAGRLTDRKARLLASALCRRAWSFLIDKRSQGAVETAEQYADGLAPELRREAAELEAERAIVGIRGHSARWWAATAAFMTAGDRPPLREVVMHTDDHLNRHSRPLGHDAPRRVTSRGRL